MAAWRCTTCGDFHEELPFAYGPDVPDSWAALPEEERSRRSEVTSDQCIVNGVDGRHFFIRGRLEIPIVGSADVFVWLVWTTLSEANFCRASDLWELEGREAEPPYSGWLNTELASVYREHTLNLKTLVHTRPVGQRPFIEVVESAHPLAKEQREGITRTRVQEIAELLLHR